jgi:hypothetical protein
MHPQWLCCERIKAKEQVISTWPNFCIIGVRHWREVAARAKIARADIELTAIAFAQSGAALSET